MPTAPEQHDPKRVAAWERRRKQIGLRVQTLRIEKGLTQEQLALLAGLSRGTLIAVEHGTSGILVERCFDIAKVLGVSGAELIEGIR